MDLTEAEDIEMRWQEYTRELFKKELHEPENHNGVITHLEPDILECGVEWTLGCSAGDYQADERAGVTRLIWRLSGR